MIYPQVREKPIVDRNSFTNYLWTGQICSFFQLLSAPPIKQNVVDFRWQFHAPGSGFLPKLRVFRALAVGANYGSCSLKELRKLLILQYAAPFPLPQEWINFRITPSSMSSLLHINGGRLREVKFLVHGNYAVTGPDLHIIYHCPPL